MDLGLRKVLAAGRLRRALKGAFRVSALGWTMWSALPADVEECSPWVATVNPTSDRRDNSHRPATVDN